MSATKSINIVIDEGNPNKPLFVEIVNDEEGSIRIGERIEKNGFTFIRITAEDITDHPDT